MGLFKRAAIRGVAYEMVRQGVCAFPTKEAMEEAADAVADAHPEMPETSPEGGHSPEELAEAAQQLMEIAHALMEQAGAAGGPPMEEGGPPSMPPSPEAAKEAEELSKTAAASDYETVAQEMAIGCMEKAAAEVKAAASGALIQGGDKGNDPSQAAQHGEIAALDKKQRPEGMYHVGQGKTDMDLMAGHIGDVSKHPGGPANSPSGTNSVNSDASKSAALKKIANKLVGLHDGTDKNKLTDAAKVDTLAQLDHKNRPQGTYLVGQGNANFSEPQAHRVGKEMPHPNGPKNSPSGTNSVIEASKTSEEDAFLVLFKKTAEDVGPALPKSLSDDEKVAAISRMIGFDRDARQAYITELYTKQAESEEGMKGDESKSDEDGDKAKKKSEEPAQKKESSLLNRIREIAASAS